MFHRFYCYPSTESQLLEFIQCHDVEFMGYFTPDVVRAWILALVLWLHKTKLYPLCSKRQTYYYLQSGQIFTLQG